MNCPRLPVFTNVMASC